jgi:predicted lipoprotein
VIRRRFLAALSVVGASLATGGCVIVATPVKKTGAADEGSVGDFDPDAMVNAIWDAKVIPYLTTRAGALPDVVVLARSNPDEAGRQYGHRAKEGNEPWTFVATIDGRIVAAETASRAATISVDTKGDGKIAAIVQIGPALRGTALRDCLNFVSFNDFKNQIDYAQFGKAFNQRVARTILAQLPRDSLIGRDVKILGAFTLEAGDRPPLVAPAQLTLGPAP